MPYKSYAKEMVRQRHGREVPDLLRDMYLERRYSQREIAEALGIGRVMVNEWLKEYGISRDSRPPVVIGPEVEAA